MHSAGAAPIEPDRSNPAARPPVALDLAQILDATAACLAESGYDGTTIRRIATRLGCAVGSIYRYCTDKRTLLSAVTQRRFEPVVQAIDDHVSLEHTVAQYAAVAAEDPQQYRLMFWLASLPANFPGGDEGADGKEAEHLSGSQGASPPAVIGRVIEGWTRQVGDPRLAERLWAMIHGCLMLGLSVDTIRSEALSLLEERDGGGERGRGETVSPAVHVTTDRIPPSRGTCRRHAMTDWR